MMRAWWVVLVAFWLAACAGSPPQPPADEAPDERPDAEVLEAADGTRLPLHRWGPEEPRRVALALHGFNDHGGSMAALGEALAEHEIAVYAYDQRGFGANRDVGHWAGYQTMAEDARTGLRILAERYPDNPPYLIGKSMGGAVALLATSGEELPAMRGTALIGPAVWSRDQMPWYQRFGLWVGARIAPGMRLTGEMAAEFDIRPTDDPAVLEQMRDDPLVLREARIDALDGLTTLMGRALSAGDALPAPSLLLYGAKDDLVPPGPTAVLAERLAATGDPGHRMVLYPEGYHMLTRYTRSVDTFGDLVAWMLDPEATLPSGHERAPETMVQNLQDLDAQR
ncbi:alpha/beta hydrolase fold protein [Thioalkalivibrio sp. K90mix]|uniref:alpha/beta fold hydrolase n=1 Tax=Thioalkalivibrio sp. (strain K90mix) TaxID=396595 RepID=UPI000195A500|nr:alpha/beta fold hydrolase [Thioalkalivibrio sp. K90mix]ADC72161.1 alpha/beta hydrolase fold protein [Thioalkalivibrio sp. K90mix]